MMVLWVENMAYTTAMFSPYHKEINKYNHFLSDLLEYIIMDGLFKRCVYTLIESELHYNQLTSTILIPEYSMKIRIVPLFHTPFGFKYLFPQMHHQQKYGMCYINGKLSAKTSFFVELVLCWPQTLSTGLPTSMHIYFPIK